MITKLVHSLKSVLNISKFERRGLFVLFFVFIVLMGYYYVRRTVGEAEPVFDEEKYAAWQANMQEALADKRSSDRYKNYESEEQSAPKVKPLQIFAHNKDSFKELLAKGLPYEVVKSLVNYRNAGATYRSKEDLKKLYSLDEATYNKLEPFIALSEEEIKSNAITPDSANRDKFKKEESIVLDINTATEKELQSIRGIGPSYAARIVKYRERLGGYINTKQLGEVYGLSQETIDLVSPHFRFSTTPNHTININAAGAKELYSHPYVSYKEAQAIVAYRNQHGNFASVSDLGKLYIFAHRDLSQLLPYLDVK